MLWTKLHWCGIYQDSGVHYKGGQNCINIALSMTKEWTRNYVAHQFSFICKVKWSIIRLN